MFNINDWVSGNKILVNVNAPASQLSAVFFNSYTGAGAARNTWTQVDVSSMVDPNTVAIHVSGILIITHGSNAETADLQMFFRQNSGQNPNYNEQCIETSIGGGQRSTMACWIPLTQNKTFEYKWNTAVYNGAWPVWSAYGANLQIDAIAVNN